MYISRLSLQNWKNFQKASTHLPRRVFLIGPNASGKSNFLDAFRFLKDIAVSGLGYAVDSRGGVSPIRCLAARASSSVLLQVELVEDDESPAWEYTVDFSQDAHRKPIIKREIVRNLVTGETILDRPSRNDTADPLLLTQTSLEQISANKEFRPIADFLASVTYQHLVPQVVRDPKGFSSVPVSNDPYGRDLLMRIHGTAANVRDARLKRIGLVLRQAVPQLQSLEIEMDSRGSPHLIGRYEHWRSHAAKQNESQFSDGTLRLLGLMWAMLDGDGPILVEEPELSLHPEVVRSLPQMLLSLQKEIRRMRKKREDYSNRQIIISTHSEEMLSDRGIAPGEVIRIESGSEGSALVSASADDRALMERGGLSAADVLLPKSGPKGEQLFFEFP